MPKTGVIASGMNRAYRTGGRIATVLGGPGSRLARVGAALQEITVKAYPDDVTVGEAWEAYAAANPRVRAFLLRLVSGGAAGELVMIHLTVVLALVTPDNPDEAAGKLGQVFAAVAGQDPEASPGNGPGPADTMPGFLAGMTQEDMAQAAAFAQSMMSRQANGPARGE